MSTALALRPTPRTGTHMPERTYRRSLPRVERVLYMCEAALVKEARGEPASRFHANCRGRSFNDSPALTRVLDPDGRFRAGRHVCVCACHRKSDRGHVRVPPALATPALPRRFDDRPTGAQTDTGPRLGPAFGIFGRRDA